MGYKGILNAQAGHRHGMLLGVQVFQNGATKTSGQASVFNGDQLLVGITEFIQQIGVQGLGKPEIKMAEGFRGIRPGNGPGYMCPRVPKLRIAIRLPLCNRRAFPMGIRSKGCSHSGFSLYPLGYRMAIGPCVPLWAVLSIFRNSTAFMGAINMIPGIQRR